MVYNGFRHVFPLNGVGGLKGNTGIFALPYVYEQDKPTRAELLDIMERWYGKEFTR